MKALWSMLLLVVLQALSTPAMAQGATQPAAPPAQILPLWSGKAPGTAGWTLPEASAVAPDGKQRITNVSQPTLAVYLPDRTGATTARTAVIIAPGGGLRLLSMTEAENTARWFNARGIVAFVLKYRILQMDPAKLGAPIPGMRPAGSAPPPELEIRNANANPVPGDARMSEVYRMAVSDVQQALSLVRANAATWGIDPRRVGMLGFSAGGSVSVGAALAPAAAATAYPDFLISIYGPALEDVVVPANAPPLFMAVGENHYNVTNGLLALFSSWKAAARPAELHVYDGVNGPFGLTEDTPPARRRPIDGWASRALEWLQGHDLAPRDSAASRP